MLKICCTTIFASSSVYLPPLINQLETVRQPFAYKIDPRTALQTSKSHRLTRKLNEKISLSGISLNSTVYVMRQSKETDTYIIKGQIINYRNLLTLTIFDPTIPHLRTICTRVPYRGQYTVAKKQLVVQITAEICRIRSTIRVLPKLELTTRLVERRSHDLNLHTIVTVSPRTPLQQC